MTVWAPCWGFCPQPASCLGRREEPWLQHPGIFLGTGYIRAGWHSIPNGKNDGFCFSSVVLEKEMWDHMSLLLFSTPMGRKLHIFCWWKQCNFHCLFVKRVCSKVKRTKSGLHCDKVSFYSTTVVALDNLFLLCASVLPVQPRKGMVITKCPSTWDILGISGF